MFNKFTKYYYVIVKPQLYYIYCTTEVCPFLDKFTKLQKTTWLLHVCLLVLPSAWNSLAPTGQIFMKFDI